MSLETPSNISDIQSFATKLYSFLPKGSIRKIQYCDSYPDDQRFNGTFYVLLYDFLSDDQKENFMDNLSIYHKNKYTLCFGLSKPNITIIFPFLCLDCSDNIYLEVIERKENSLVYDTLQFECDCGWTGEQRDYVGNNYKLLEES